nr:flavodoxin-dependent (E)-4-hydroxy-3-methylbut-2-enyl-diphosphate synthase [Desulfovibrio sp.]
MSAQIRLGSVTIGGGAPVRVQSMTNTDTRDIEATLAQIGRLAKLGCEIVRVAIPDEKAAAALSSIVLRSPLPVVADIHFDWRLAIASMEAGAAGIRINPGNIGSRTKTEKVIDAAKARGAVIRVGVNSGSLEKDLLAKYG